MLPSIDTPQGDQVARSPATTASPIPTTVNGSIGASRLWRSHHGFRRAEFLVVIASVSNDRTCSRRRCPSDDHRVGAVDRGRAQRHRDASPPRLRGMHHEHVGGRGSAASMGSRTPIQTTTTVRLPGADATSAVPEHAAVVSRSTGTPQRGPTGGHRDRDRISLGVPADVENLRPATGRGR
jgi:hypothetical protein